MTKNQMNQLLTIVVCSALVVLVIYLSFHSPSADTCLNNNTNEPGQKLERAGTEMLWESLSHQFVSLEY